MIRLYYKTFNVKVNSTSLDWRSNSRLTSLYDLCGSRLFIHLKSSGGITIGSGIDFELAERHRREVLLKELVLKIPNGIVLSFDKDNLTETISRYGYKLYTFDFPSTIEEISESAYYDAFKEFNF